MNILQLKVEGLKTFKNGTLEIDFFSEKRVSKSEIGSDVTLIRNNFYKLNSISLVGINASGKTTALNVIEGVLSIYIKNESINNHNRLIEHFDDSLSISAFLIDEDNVYKIESTIIKEDVMADNIYFSDETLSIKKIQKNFSKTMLSQNIKYSQVILRKDIKNSFLKKEDSIFSSILNDKDDDRQLVYDLMDHTNNNYFAYFITNMSTSFIKYLDTSIEDFSRVYDKSENSKKLPQFNIKFKNSEKIIKSDFFDLQNYLSSGTIKGLNILANVVKVLDEGGYLIIDEIENHLNKRIVESILEFFLSDANRNGATIIFSTHYVEILDSINRSDSIYVLNKKNFIEINKLSTLLGSDDRNDKKKSDIFLSGIVNTVPSYTNYLAIKRDVLKIFDENEASNESSKNKKGVNGRGGEMRDDSEYKK